MFDTKIEKVIVNKLDLEHECYYDLITGHGIILDSVDAYTNKGEKIYRGLQSEYFGTDFSDELAFADRYSCKCGKYKGKMYESQICDMCGTKVEYIDIDITKTGWIVLRNGYKVISPIYAMKLQDALGTVNGEKVLNKILEVRYDSDIPNQNERELMDMKIHPFLFKGMTWLVDNIDEVLDYYMKRKPTKKALFEELKCDADKIFTKAIPVISSILRIELPGVKDEKLFKMRLNTYYQSLIRNTNIINSYDTDDVDSRTLISINRYLASMQSDINEIFTEIFKTIDGKKGIINSKVLGGRYNFSCRNIIAPSSGKLRTDEIELCYLSFMELYRYELINYYSKIQGCGIMEASQKWKRALLHFDQTFYNIMKHMVHENKELMYVMINRNPSINYGSFLVMKVANVKPNINDKTLVIPTPILVSMGADFDGDQLNVFRIIGMDLSKRMAKCLNPRYNLYIDRINGRINKAAMPQKDEIVGFWAFCNN